MKCSDKKIERLWISVVKKIFYFILFKKKSFPLSYSFQNTVTFNIPSLNVYQYKHIFSIVELIKDSLKSLIDYDY